MPSGPSARRRGSARRGAYRPALPMPMRLAAHRPARPRAAGRPDGPDRRSSCAPHSARWIPCSTASGAGSAPARSRQNRRVKPRGGLAQSVASPDDTRSPAPVRCSPAATGRMLKTALRPCDLEVDLVEALAARRGRRARCASAGAAQPCATQPTFSRIFVGRMREKPTHARSPSTRRPRHQPSRSLRPVDLVEVDRSARPRASRASAMSDLAVDRREVDAAAEDDAVVHALEADLDAARRIVERHRVLLLEARRPRLVAEVEDVVRVRAMRLGREPMR